MSSGLPTGGPSPTGLRLDPSLSGALSHTLAKDELDTGTSDQAEAGSLYRRDDPRQVSKPQDGDDSKDLSMSGPSFYGLGPSDQGKTKYPYRDGVPNEKNASVRVASRFVLGATLKAILDSTDASLLQRSQELSPQLARADLKNFRWTFTVVGKSDTYTVKIKALPKGKIKAFDKLDLEMSCTCPAWRWLGPEHHAQSGDYQLGKPVGTASTPVVRDPGGVNKVCKHVAAVLRSTQGWSVTKKK